MPSIPPESNDFNAGHDARAANYMAGDGAIKEEKKSGHGGAIAGAAAGLAIGGIGGAIIAHEMSKLYILSHNLHEADRRKQPRTQTMRREQLLHQPLSILEVTVVPLRATVVLPKARLLATNQVFMTTLHCPMRPDLDLQSLAVTVKVCMRSDRRWKRHRPNMRKNTKRRTISSKASSTKYKQVVGRVNPLPV